MDGNLPPKDTYAPLRLQVPEPQCRPGSAPDFSHIDIGEAGRVPKPDLNISAKEARPFAEELIRVLDADGVAKGPWAAGLTSEDLMSGLRAMVRVRSFDARLMMSQRQGKTSFYIQCLGEEALGVGQQLAMTKGDMHFPSYRQVGILMVQDYPVQSLINQIYSNEEDPLKGRQLPIMYSSREHGFFTISGNLATQWPQATGWAMASAIKGDTKIASAWIGDGATAEGDWHSGMVFASVYKPPVILNIVNNQWAISSFNGMAGGNEASFAARGYGYGIPALRVDGNDFLAVLSVSRWAAERARRGAGPTLIEWVTYRKGAHSTSDDPSRYRPENEADNWPLGDPIDRLRDHMIRAGLITAADADKMVADADDEMRAAEQAAEAVGLVADGRGARNEHIFSDIYAEPPGRLLEQREKAGC